MPTIASVRPQGLSAIAPVGGPATTTTARLSGTRRAARLVGTLMAACAGVAAFAGVAGAAPSPVQVTTWADTTSSNAAFQTAAANPNDGTGLALVYRNDGGTESWVTVPLDAAGAASGPEVPLITGAAVYSNQNNAVAYDPQSGGWVACWGDSAVAEITCGFLTKDGSLKAGSPFIISASTPVSGGWEYYQSISLAFSEKDQRWMAAYGDYYDFAINYFDKDGTVGTGTPIISDGTGLGGIALAYSPASDKYMAVYRHRIAPDTAAGAYVALVNSDGTLVSASTRVGPGDIAYQNPTIAYNSVRDEFMVANWITSGADAGKISTQRYKASDGSAVAGETVSAAGTPGTGNRMVIASQTGSDTLRAISNMTDSGLTGVYSFPISGDGTTTGAEPVYVPASSGVNAGARPRIVFNQGTCSYMATFNRGLADSSWNLFSAAMPTSSPCKYAVTVTKTVTGTGAVTSSPAGIDCGSACSAEFAVGSSVTLTAAAASGSSFSGWAGDCTGSAATCTVVMDRAKSVTAQFRAEPTATTLRSQVLSPRRRVVSGQALRVGLRAVNTGQAPAEAVSSCLRLPANMVITRAPGAVRSGRTVCFRIGQLAPGATATRVVTVRGVSTRRVTRTLTGSVSAQGVPRQAAQPRSVTIIPRTVRPRVTG